MLPIRAVPVLLALCALLLAHAAQAQRFEDNPWWRRRVLNIAHAGGECEAPTNTLHAWKTALTKGVDMLEFDVHSSADGVLVVIHDDTVDRVTNGSGRVDALTLAELKKLDKAYDFRPSPGPGCPAEQPVTYPFRGIATGDVPPPPGFSANDFRIASVREVLETFPEALMSIEIKGEAPDALPTAERLAALLREFGRSDDVLIASFDDEVIAHFKAAAPEVHTTPGTLQTAAFLFGGAPIDEHQALQVPPSYLGVDVASPSNVAFIHSLGIPVYVFLQESLEYESLYEELLDAGVDGIINGRPAAFEAVVRERGALFEIPLELEEASRSANGRDVELELACPSAAGAPWCRAALDLWLDFTPPGGEVRSARLARTTPAAVPRGERGSARLRLSWAARLVLAVLGPLETRLEITPLGPTDGAGGAVITLGAAPEPDPRRAGRASR